MTTGGLVFDGNDEYTVAGSYIAALTGAATIGIVIQLADTTADAVWAGVQSETHRMWFQTETGDSKTLGGQWREDAGSTIRGEITMPTAIETEPMYIVLTSNGTTDSMFVNGTYQATTTGDFIALLGATGIGSGNGMLYLPAGSKVRAFEFYTAAITKERVLQNYNYYASYYGW